MSDCSSASLKLQDMEELRGKAHVLCFQHFRQHLWDAVATFNLRDKNEFWTLAMKVLKWRGYSDDEQLQGDILSLQRMHGARNDRVRQVLGDLMKYRMMLCCFHVSKVFTNMRIASSIAESTHSAIKGGGELSRYLRASNFTNHCFRSCN